MNRELIQKVYDQVTQHPETHMQSAWHTSSNHNCGTTSCVAGWAMEFSGYHWLNVHSHRQMFMDPFGKIHSVNEFDSPRPSAIGQELLGLDEFTAYSLFIETDNGQAVEMLKAMLDEDLLEWNRIRKSREEGVQTGRYLQNLPEIPPWKVEG